MTAAAIRDPASVLPPPAAPIATSNRNKPTTNDTAGAAESSSSTIPTDAGQLDINNPDPKVIDMEILGQLLDMDEGPDHEFSRGLVMDYFDQASATLTEIEHCLTSDVTTKAQQLKELSEKAHFLKGSSAALGVVNVRDTCEALQNLGKCKDEAGATSIAEGSAWDRSNALIPSLRQNHDVATVWLKALCAM